MIDRPDQPSLKDVLVVELKETGGNFLADVILELNIF